MKAIQLTGYKGFDSMQVFEVEKPKPAPNEVLLEVKAAGVNFAELELTKGRYRIPKEPPFIMGFEAAGVVVELGARVKNLNVGDRITSVASSGGYAEYATADATVAIPIPEHLLQRGGYHSSSGAVGMCATQAGSETSGVRKRAHPICSGRCRTLSGTLAKIMGVRRVIALASSKEKLDLVTRVGADVAINYTATQWADQVREATEGKGVDVVLEAASGEVGDQSFKLMAPFGRMVVFGARNIRDTISPEKVQQLIYKNQSLMGFNVPSLPPEQIAECVPPLLNVISRGDVKLFARNTFPLST
jgi:NADPH2:quinone reductase